MDTYYVVCDVNGFPVSKEDDSPIRFGDFRIAERRAKLLALDFPGEGIIIYEAVAEVCAAIVPPSTARVYPIEHYKTQPKSRGRHVR